MHVLINDTPHTLTEPATVADALAAMRAVPPYAVAVNREFVPRHRYASLQLRAGDTIEIIRPVTGG